MILENQNESREKNQASLQLEC